MAWNGVYNDSNPTPGGGTYGGMPGYANTGGNPGMGSGPVIAPGGGVSPYANPALFAGNPAMQAVVSQMPGYQSILSGQNGSLGGQFQAPTNANTYGQLTQAGSPYEQALAGVNSLGTMAHDTSLSPYAQAEMTRLGQQTAQEIGAVDTANQSATHGAMDALATTGGLQSGARENLAAQGQRADINARQNVYANAQQLGTGIGAGDAQFKQGLLTNLPGMYQGLAGQGLAAGQFDTGQNMASGRMNAGSAIGDVYGQNGFNQGQWGQLGSLVGAGQTADAQQAAASKPDKGLLGGGGFLGTGIGTSGGIAGSGIGAGGGNGALGQVLGGMAPGVGFNPYAAGQHAGWWS